MQTIITLFLQICLHLYGTCRRVALVLFFLSNLLYIKCSTTIKCYISQTNFNLNVFLLKMINTFKLHIEEKILHTKTTRPYCAYNYLHCVVLLDHNAKQKEYLYWDSEFEFQPLKTIISVLRILSVPKQNVYRQQLKTSTFGWDFI